MNILDIVQEAEKILNRRIFYLWIESEIKHASEMRNQRSESSSTPHSLLPSWFFSTTTIHQWTNVVYHVHPRNGEQKEGEEGGHGLEEKEEEEREEMETYFILLLIERAQSR